MSDSEAIDLDNMTDDELQARIERTRKLLGEMQAKARPKKKSKQERQTEQVTTALAGLTKAEQKFCKELGQGPVALTNDATRTTAAKLQHQGLVLLYGDADGALFAKPLKHWFRVAFNEAA